MPERHLTRGPPALGIAAPGRLADALSLLGLAGPRPVLLVVGAADGLDPALRVPLAALFSEVLVPLLQRADALAIDGGTDAGIMRLLGAARMAAGARFPLLGIAPLAKVRLPAELRSDLDAGSDADAAAPAAGHSHLLLVPGPCWGDEIPWMGEAAALLGRAGAVASLVIGGGEVTARDVAASLAGGRPTLALAGSGGVAGKLAEAPPASPLLRVVPRAGNWAALAGLLGPLLGLDAGGAALPRPGLA